MVKLHPMMRDYNYAPPLDIPKVEKRYGGRYVGDFPGKTKYGWSADVAVSVFYRPDPQEPHTNRYFGFFTDVWTETLKICDADYVEGHEFVGMRTPEGILYSTCRHDFRKFENHYVDGGWDCIRSNGGDLVSLRVMNGEIEILETKVEPEGD